MPHTTNEYKRAAADARKLAARASEEWERQELLRVAEQWDRFAENAERKPNSENSK
jgi:hypothetical protein